MKKFLLKILFYLELIMSDEWNKYKVYEKFLGIKFGKNVRILHYPRFGSEPYLIEIGNNVTITRGVCFVTHDGGVTIFRKDYPGLNVFGKIKIGNNVFIGINTIILPGVTIGNNVVIGAGSLVNKNIPDNVVAAGVPVKIIKSIDDYKNSVLHKGIFIGKVTEEEKRKIIDTYFKNNNNNKL